jgi:hypothetical protein
VAEQTRERLASSPYDRAWARVVASELGQLASQPLPEIPDGWSRAPVSSATAGEPTPEAADGQAGAGARRSRPRERGPRRPPRLSDRPSSILGGAIMLVVGALIVVVVVVVLFIVLSSGGGSTHTSGLAATSPSGTATGTSGTASTATTPTAQVVSQTNLNPPSGSISPAKGVGIVVKEGNAYGVVIEAAHMAPNNKNAYAAWLYNSPTDAYRLGFVSPPVGKSGTLQVGSTLPTNAGHYKQLLMSLETQSNPKSPGTIILQGPFTGVPPTG